MPVGVNEGISEMDGDMDGIDDGYCDNVGSTVLGLNVGPEVEGTFDGRPDGVNVEGEEEDVGFAVIVGVIESAGGFLISTDCCLEGLMGTGATVGACVVVVGKAVTDGSPVEGANVGLSTAASIETDTSSSTVAFWFTESPPVGTNT
jgi:hypothetical protein